MNKRERMEAVLGKRKTDYVPSSYWFHFTDIPGVQEKAKAHLEFHKSTDMDFMKIMYEFGYSNEFKITKASDWEHISTLGCNSPEYKKQIELIKRIQDGLKEDCMVFTTMFGAFKMAQFMAGEEMLMAHIMEAPQSVMAGIRAIAEMLADWASGFSRAGVDGIMYAAQYAEKTRFSKAFWEMTVKACDELVLERIQAEKKLILLHMCGMAQYGKEVDLSRFADYPMDIASWAVHSSHVSMKEGRRLFPCAILGGMDNYGSITRQDKSAIENEVHQVVEEAGRTGLILGADCVILENPSIENVRTAVTAAREYAERGRKTHEI